MIGDEATLWRRCWRTAVVVIALAGAAFVCGRENVGWWCVVPLVLAAWLAAGRWALRR